MHFNGCANGNFILICVFSYVHFYWTQKVFDRGAIWSFIKGKVFHDLDIRLWGTKGLPKRHWCIGTERARTSLLFYSTLLYSILFHSIIIFLCYSTVFYSILVCSVLLYSILIYSIPFQSVIIFLFYSTSSIMVLVCTCDVTSLMNVDRFH